MVEMLWADNFGNKWSFHHNKNLLTCLIFLDFPNGLISFLLQYITNVVQRIAIVRILVTNNVHIFENDSCKMDKKFVL